jgi:hypothetical protein
MVQARESWHVMSQISNPCVDSLVFAPNRFFLLAMTGSSTICGLLPCTNGRHLFSDKPRTISFDGEIFIGYDDQESAQSVLALIHFFIPTGEVDPENGLLYFVCGKMVSVNDQTIVGDDCDSSEYDLVIDAETVCPVSVRGFLLLNFVSVKFHAVGAPKMLPCRPRVFISGAVCNIFFQMDWILMCYLKAGLKRTDREFQIDLKQYAINQHQDVGHIALFLSSNRRFQQKAPLPNTGAMISLIGAVLRPSVKSGGDHAMKRIVVEVLEVAFLSVDNTVGFGSPVKGASLFWLFFSLLWKVCKGKSAKYQWDGGRRTSSATASSNASVLESEASTSTKVPVSKSAGKRRRVEEANE